MTRREYRHDGRVRTVSLTFPLPEEQEEMDAALHGMKYRLAIEEFFEQSLRRRLKYQQLKPTEVALLETLRDELVQACEGLPLP